jgi:hypothetical protein
VSITHYSLVVVGVRLNELYHTEKLARSIVRYCQDTGIPYQAKVYDTKHFWCKIEIDDPWKTGDISSLVKDKTSLEDGSCLCLFSNGEDEDMVVGNKVCKCEPRENDGIDKDSLIKFWQDAEIKLRRCGYNGVVELFLIHYVA